jgi:hypothetical protein
MTLFSKLLHPSALRFLICVGGYQGWIALNQSRVIDHKFEFTPIEQKNPSSITKEQQQFLRNKWQSIKEHQNVSTPQTYLDFVKDNRQCAEILQKMLEDVSGRIDPNKQTRLHNNAVTLFSQFWDSGRLKEAFRVGKFIEPRYCSPHLKQIETIGRGALFCHEWSQSEKVKQRDELLKEIGGHIMSIIEGFRQHSDEKLKTCDPEIIEDQHGIPRAFVGFAWSDDAGTKIKPKIFITLAATRIDSEVSYSTIVRLFLQTNLNCIPQTHPTGGWSSHKGFQTMSDFLEEKIVEKIEKMKETFPPSQREHIEISLIGYGTGAAIANILALSLGKKVWCHTCIAYTLATPCAFRGAVTIPENVLIKNFVHELDVVSTDLLFHPIGDTFVLNDPDDKRWFKSPRDVHTKFFKEFFLEKFSFEKGERSIVKTITYNHKGQLESELI